MEVELVKGLKFHKKQDVAIVGAGMTTFKRRLLETGKELSYFAVKQALEEAGLDISDIEMVVMGSAPDAFDGVALKGEYLLDGSGGSDRPYMRVFVGGGTGVFAPIAGYWHVASGLADVCLVVCEEKMSSCYPHPQSAFKYIWDPILERPLKPNLIWIFALEMRRYMHVNNVKHEDIALVSVKNKANALDHPCA
ncbi:MAG: thiolase domain-containing protein, partial [Archaeoglobaceae archaeon]